MATVGGAERKRSVLYVKPRQERTSSLHSNQTELENQTRVCYHQSEEGRERLVSVPTEERKEGLVNAPAGERKGRLDETLAEERKETLVNITTAERKCLSNVHGNEESKKNAQGKEERKSSMSSIQAEEKRNNSLANVHDQTGLHSVQAAAAGEKKNNVSGDQHGSDYVPAQARMQNNSQDLQPTEDLKASYGKVPEEDKRTTDASDDEPNSLHVPPSVVRKNSLRNAIASVVRKNSLRGRHPKEEKEKSAHSSTDKERTNSLDRPRETSGRKYSLHNALESVMQMNKWRDDQPREEGTNNWHDVQPRSIEERTHSLQYVGRDDGNVSLTSGNGTEEPSLQHSGQVSHESTDNNVHDSGWRQGSVHYVPTQARRRNSDSVEVRTNNQCALTEAEIQSILQDEGEGEGANSVHYDYEGDEEQQSILGADKEELDEEEQQRRWINSQTKETKQNSLWHAHVTGKKRNSVDIVQADEEDTSSLCGLQETEDRRYSLPDSPAGVGEHNVQGTAERKYSLHNILTAVVRKSSLRRSKAKEERKNSAHKNHSGEDESNSLSVPAKGERKNSLQNVLASIARKNSLRKGGRKNSLHDDQAKENKNSPHNVHGSEDSQSSLQFAHSEHNSKNNSNAAEGTSNVTVLVSGERPDTLSYDQGEEEERNCLQARERKKSVYNLPGEEWKMDSLDDDHSNEEQKGRLHDVQAEDRRGSAHSIRSNEGRKGSLPIVQANDRQVNVPEEEEEEGGTNSLHFVQEGEITSDVPQDRERSVHYSEPVGVRKHSLHYISPLEEHILVFPEEVITEFDFIPASPVKGKLSKDDYIYGLVLQSVVNPLGAPDHTKGNRPADLAEHLRKVFDKEKQEHAQCVRDVHHTKPSNVVLNVTVLEAKELVQGKNASGDPYCVVAVCSPASPRQSPRSSPASRRKQGSLEHGDVRRTQAARSARWNEHFEIDVKDLSSEELHVVVFASDGQEDVPARTSGVKGLFKQLKYSKSSQSFYGRLKLPVRDIPASGWERWFTVFSGRDHVPGGQVKLRLELAVRQSTDQLLSAESDLCSLDDFYAAVYRLYSHGQADGGQTFTELPEQSRKILHQFAVQNRFTKLQRLLMELIVLLDLVTGSLPVVVDEKLIKDAVVSLEMEWFQVTGGKQEKGVISENQFLMFNKAATEYVSQMIRGLKESNSLPKLFPPTQLKLTEINNKVSVAVSLLNLHLWNSTDRARKDASGLLAERIQDDVRTWLHEKLESPEIAQSKDPELAESRHLVQVVRDTISVLTPIFSISSYFTRLSVDYYKTAALAVDSVLSNSSQQLMLRIDRYQVRYHKFMVNIRESSTATLQLYFALTNLFNVIRSTVNHRELFMVTLARYQSWFEHAVMFWLQTFREECVRRMQKALEIEKDVVQVTSLVKYSKSSVDVVSCFSKITTEWKQIDFQDADIAILGVTKITDTICDGARAYAEQVHNILETNGYYDFNDDEVFDVTDQLCITLNNICHIQKFLYDLRELLNWDIVCENMSVKHEDEKVGENSLRVLEELVDSASDDIFARGRLLMRNITEKMAVDIRRLTKRFTQKYPEKKSSVDPLIGYLDTSLDILYEKLEAIIFPLMLEQIWYVLLHAFRDTLLHGQSTSYYQYNAAHLETLKQYVLRGTDEAGTECQTYVRIVKELQENAMTTEQLQLQYYSELCEGSVKTPALYFGHLAVKMAYRYQDDARVTLNIKVDSASHLPAMHKDNTSTPFVSVRLSPACRFKGCKEQDTQVVKGCTDPVYNTVFFYPDLEEESFLTKGTVAIFTVWSKESLLPNDFLGELVIPMAHARQMNTKQTIDDIAAMILPLQRPKEPQDGPFKVLVERARYEKHAKAVVRKRRETTGWETINPVCAPFIGAMCKMMGKKPDVEGNKYGPSLS